METKQKGYFAMKWKLIVAIVPPTIIIIMAILLGIYFNVRSSMIAEVEEKLHAEGESAAKTVEVWGNESIKKMDMLGEILSEERLGDQAAVVDYFTDNQDFITDSNSCYAVYEDGTCLSRDGIESFPEYLDQEWYKFGLTCENAAFDECSYYTEDGWSEYSVTLSKSLYDKTTGNVNGMLGTDITFDGIKEMVDSQKNTDGTEFVLIDTKSEMIIGATDDEIGRAHV